MSVRSKPNREGEAPAEPERHVSELPEGWAISSVGECFLDVRNGTTAAQNKNEIGLPVSRIETIQNRRFDMSRVQHLDDVSDDFVENFRYRPGDIAFSHINSFEHVGKTALYDGEPELFIHGMNLLRLRLGHEFIEPRFAHLFMQTKFFREEVRQRVGHAVNQVSINQKNLAEVPFIVAPLAEQRRIVGKLELLLGKVSSSQQRLSRVPGLLKRFRQSVLAAACSGKLTADWREENSTDETGHDLFATICKRKGCEAEIAEAAFERPESWAVVKLDLLLRGKNGLAYGILKPGEFVADGVPMIRVMDIGDGKRNDTDLFRVAPSLAKEFKRTTLETGDILLAVMATVGRAMVVPSSLHGANVNRALAVLKLTGEIDSDFACGVIRSPFFQDRFANEKVGSAQQRINLGDLREFVLPLPPLSEQQEIVRRVEKLFAFADQIESRLRQAQAHVDRLTQSLLAKAFRGELVPTEAALAAKEGRDYETAETLLTRIRATSKEESIKPSQRKKGQGRDA